MDRRDITKALGVSLSNLKRSMPNVSFNFHNYCKANPNLVRSVAKFYETHTQKKTAEHFGLKEKQVDHIAYRFKLHKPKRIKWTDSQVIEAAKMAGLISMKAQAKYFNRPNAHVGSIRSLWMKKFKMGGCSINGMTHWHAKELVKHKTRYIKPMGDSRKGKAIKFRRLILWVDMEKCLKKDVPTFIVNAIKTLADFQRWLWRSKNPKPLILKMIKERESA